MLEGRFENKDSRGNSGKLGPGDVQWMTAGAGAVHSEMPEKEFLRTWGNLHGFHGLTCHKAIK
jgi:quercetin 2,3-dioxygenase